MINEGQTINGFILERKGNMPLVNEYGYMFTHIKTGAIVYYLLEDEETKTFNLAFDTPLLDNSGVRHIIEHSVLCGSKKYRSKDPFIDVKKGSLATYMNALTCIDKTRYLFSTPNYEDFLNLIDFYLDGCFNPLCIKDKKIFDAEGWHYEINDEEKLIINGVVYNEMKKYCSDKMKVIMNKSLSDIYPGTFLSFNSGGDPKAIPRLTYEKFVKYYKTYYRPSNSVLVLSGKMDIENVLSIINDYYKEYDRRKYSADSYVKSDILIGDYYEHNFPASSAEFRTNDDLVRFFIKVDSKMSTHEEIALSLLSELLDYDGAYSLRDILVKTGLAKKVTCFSNSFTCGAYITISCEGVKSENIPKIKNAIKKFIVSIKKDGVNANILKDFLKDFRYCYFRNDVKNYGLEVSDKILSCIFEKELPFDVYIDQACDYILDDLSKSSHVINEFFNLAFDEEKIITIVFKPDEKYEKKIEENERKRLSNKLKKMSEVEKSNVILEQNNLMKFRNRIDSKEVLDSIPRVDLNTFSHNPRWADFTVGGPIAYYKVNSRNITTVKFYFDIEGFTLEEIKVLKLIKHLLFKADTKKYSSKTVSNLTTEYFVKCNCKFDFRLKAHSDFCVEVSFENDKVNDVFLFLYEIFKNVEYCDKDLILSVIRESSAKMHSTLTSNPDKYISSLLCCNFNQPNYLIHTINSVEYNNYLCQLSMKMDKSGYDIRPTLRRVSKKLFSDERFSASVFTNDENLMKELPVKFIVLRSMISQRKRQDKPLGFSYENMNAGVALNTLVNYVGVRYNIERIFGDNKFMYEVIRNILRDSYLWDNIRLIGGAYGCIVNVSYHGYMSIVSYRDPQYEKTLEVFDGIADYLANFDEDITKYIISEYGEIERYDTFTFIEDRTNNAIRNGITKEIYQKYFDEFLKMTSEDVRRFGRNLLNVKPSCIAIASSEEKILSDKNRFSKIIKM